MAFADPQTITVSGTARTLPRVGQSDNAGAFRKDDAGTEFQISHKLGSRNRHVFRINDQKIGADPLQPSVNRPYSMSVTLTVDVPSNGGYSLAEQKALMDAFVAYLSAGSGAKITQFLGGES